jgi:hypothetical protein
LERSVNFQPGQSRGITYSAGGTKHALDEWSTVEDVRTGIRNHDPEMLELADKLRRLSTLVEDSGLAVESKGEKLAA